MNSHLSELRKWQASLVFLSTDLASFGPDSIAMIRQSIPRHKLTTQIFPLLIDMNTILRSSLNRVLYGKYTQILSSLNALIKDRVKLIKQEESPLHSDLWALASRHLSNEEQRFSLIKCSGQLQDLFFECHAAALHELADGSRIAQDIEGFKGKLPENRQLLIDLHLVNEEDLDRLVGSLSEQFDEAQKLLMANDFGTLKRTVERIQLLMRESAQLIRT